MICKRVFYCTTVNYKKTERHQNQNHGISVASFRRAPLNHHMQPSVPPSLRNVQSETIASLKKHHALRTELQNATQRKDLAIPRSCCSTLLISHPSSAKTLVIVALTETATHVPTTKQHCHYRKFAEPSAWTPYLSVGHVVVSATLSTPRHTQVQRDWIPTQALERCSATNTDLRLPEPAIARAKLKLSWRTRAGCDQHTRHGKEKFSIAARCHMCFVSDAFVEHSKPAVVHDKPHRCLYSVCTAVPHAMHVCCEWIMVICSRWWD